MNGKSLLNTAIQLKVAFTSSLVAFFIALMVYLINDNSALALLSWFTVCVLNVLCWHYVFKLRNK